jgi:hypothetical protein
MDRSIPSGMAWLAPWEAVGDGSALEAELRREVSSGHPLYGLPAVAVGRRTDCDDVLFRVDHASGRLAVVHLTWRTAPEPEPTWPCTRLFSDWQNWIGNCMEHDYVDYQAKGAKSS